MGHFCSCLYTCIPLKGNYLYFPMKQENALRHTLTVQDFKKTGSRRAGLTSQSCIKTYAGYAESDSAPSRHPHGRTLPGEPLQMTVIKFFTLCPKINVQAIYLFGVLSFCPSSPVPATSEELLIKYATSIKQYVSYIYCVNHSTIHICCQCVLSEFRILCFYSSSRKSILLTETSYATRFSVSVSDIFFTYSLLWILPQTCTCPPTSKPEANLAFRPQQMHGM